MALKSVVSRFVVTALILALYEWKPRVLVDGLSLNFGQLFGTSNKKPSATQTELPPSAASAATNMKQLVERKSLSALSDAQLQGKVALVRVDFNVPLTPRGDVADDTRIRASVPTIRYLSAKGAKVVLASHLGRPSASDENSNHWTMNNVAMRLSELLEGVEVHTVADCVGDKVTSFVDSMKPGDILMLGNVRLNTGETKNDPQFAKDLSSIADIFVQDAFGTAHRTHASNVGVAEHLYPRVAGFNLQREVDYFAKILADPPRPFVAILGGSKVSTKFSMLQYVLPKVDKCIITGAMAFTLLKVMGGQVGKSPVEENFLNEARRLMKDFGSRIVLPVDVVAASDFKTSDVSVVSAMKIPRDLMGLDIGPSTLDVILEIVRHGKSFLWNGPPGVFEEEKFSVGTFSLARMLAQRADEGATVVVGGGDTAAAVARAGVASHMSHISTGGGASLQMMEGRSLPGVQALQDDGALAHQR